MIMEPHSRMVAPLRLMIMANLYTIQREQPLYQPLSAFWITVVQMTKVYRYLAQIMAFGAETTILWKQHSMVIHQLHALEVPSYLLQLIKLRQVSHLG